MDSAAAPLISGASRRLGRFEIGPVAFGTSRFISASLSEAQGLLETALDAEMNLVDTGDVYGIWSGSKRFGSVEERLGRVLAAAPALRSRLVLGTKGGVRPPIPYDSSASYLKRACEDSLTRLGVDVIDLYQIHRPDFFTHPASVAATLMQLREEGKIIEIGVSNYTPSQFSALQAHLDCPIVSTQPQYSAAHPGALRDGTLDLCMELGTVPLVWGPLAGGALASGDGIRPELIETLDRLAEREDTDRSTVALAFVLAHPSRPVVIVGTQTPARIRSSRAALSCGLDHQDLYDILRAGEGHHPRGP